MEVEPQRTPERDAYYARIGRDDLAPLWQVLKGLVPKEPSVREVPKLWRYDAIRPFIMEAGRLITAKEAERRVLVLENPALKGESRITSSLYAGLQLILKGEVAPSHRHAASALRFIIEGRGAYTSVNGERTYMNPGDFVLTQNWTWHDHGSDSDEPVIWLDGLDIPVTTMLNQVFYESYPEKRHPVTRPDDESYFKWGSGLRPRFE